MSPRRSIVSGPLASLSLLAGLTLVACRSDAGTTTQAPDCPDPVAAQAAEASRDRTAEIDALATRARELFEVPGLAIAVVHNGEVVLARGYGEREIGSGVAVDEQTSFQIASNTKAFIATAIGLLVADGKLDWDDRVTEHMPELKLWSEHATTELSVRDLLSHRVGLATWAGDLMWISSSIDLPTLLSRLQHLPADSGMRERYGYSNLMFVVAGELIRVKAGEPWQDFLRGRVLDPLGMDAVATRAAELDGNQNVARPHIEVDGEWRTIERLDIGVTGAAGALDASVIDMSKWLRMQLQAGVFEGKQIVPAEVIDETRTPHMFLRTPAEDLYEPARHLIAYGLGWSLADYRGRLLVQHGGGLPGMTSRVFLVPEEQLGVVVLTNSESPASALLALQVADLFLTEELGKDYLREGAAKLAEAEAKVAEAKAEAEADPDQKLGPLPAKLEGEYKNPMLGAAKIELVDGGLWFFAHEHGGMRCRFAEQARLGPDAKAPVGVDCTWEDPNMGISLITITDPGTRKPTLKFQVRPEFYDPLEYTFERTR